MISYTDSVQQFAVPRKKKASFDEKVACAKKLR